MGCGGLDAGEEEGVFGVAFGALGGGFGGVVDGGGGVGRGGGFEGGFGGGSGCLVVLELRGGGIRAGGVPLFSIR